MSIPPSWHIQLSSCKRIFEKWCFDQEEEGKEASKFCLTKWVHHKIITNDTFSIKLFLFAKITLYICIGTIKFEISDLLLSTRICLLHSQKLMLLFDVDITTLNNLTFSHISTSPLNFHDSLSGGGYYHRCISFHFWQSLKLNVEI